MFNDGYSGIIDGLVGTNINLPLALFQSAGLLNIRYEVDWAGLKNIHTGSEQQLLQRQYRTAT